MDRRGWIILILTKVINSDELTLEKTVMIKEYGKTSFIVKQRGHENLSDYESKKT